MTDLASVTPLYRWLVTLAFAIVIAILSLTPGKSRTRETFLIRLVALTPTLLQKFLHVAMYAVLSALCFWTFEQSSSRTTATGLSFIVTMSLGSVLEWCQTRIPGRYGTKGDVALNGIGIMAGLLAALLLL